MTEAEAIKAAAQKREFPETMEIFARIRAAMAEQLFKTKVSETVIREELFLKVQTLDAMIGEMEMLLANSASEDAVTDYIEALATTGE